MDGMPCSTYSDWSGLPRPMAEDCASSTAQRPSRSMNGVRSRLSGVHLLWSESSITSSTRSILCILVPAVLLCPFDFKRFSTSLQSARRRSTCIPPRRWITSWFACGLHFSPQETRDISKNSQWSVIVRARPRSSLPSSAKSIFGPSSSCLSFGYEMRWTRLQASHRCRRSKRSAREMSISVAFRSRWPRKE